MSRPRRVRLARVLSWIALTTSVLVLLAAGGLWVAFNHYAGQIERISIPGILGFDKPAKSSTGAQNLLLIGSDSREGANAKGTQSKGANFITGQRADTVILIHLYGKSEKVELVSFPRDSWVEIPAYTNPKTGNRRDAHFGRLNSAFSLGGPSLLIATIEQASGVRVDHFLQLDFTGFKEMVNKLGGVDICLTRPAKEPKSRIDLAAGRHHIDGDVALAFVRQRYRLPNADIDRIARQQQLMGSLANKVLSAGTLLNPLRLNSFLDVATGSLVVDETLSNDDIRDLALRLRHFSASDVLFTTVPVADLNARRNGALVVLLDQPKLEVLFDSLRRDQPPSTEASTPTGLIVKPSQIRIAVFNGSGAPGLARRAAADLQGVGFQMSGIPSNRGTGATETTIFYGLAKADSARTVAAALPGSKLVSDPNLGGTLEVVVGASYDGARPVAVAGTSTTKPKSSGPRSSNVKTASKNECTR